MNKKIFSSEFKNMEEFSVITESLFKLISSPSIILLSGDLSSGKTTFVSLFCKLLKINTVQSPTYAIHQRYKNEYATVDHFDLYRLETQDEIESSAFYDLIEQVSDYKFVEWPQRVDIAHFPINTLKYMIQFKLQNDGIRKLELFEIS